MREIEIGQHARDRSWAFSSAELLIGVGLLAAVLGTYSQFGIWGAAPVALLVAVLCIFVGHRFQRRIVRRAGWLMLVPALPITLVLMFLNLMLDDGPVLFSSRWPEHVHTIAEIARDDLSGAKVFSLIVFLDQEHVWRQHVPPDKLAEVVETVSLARVEKEEMPRSFLANFPGWWAPTVTDKCQFFAPNDTSSGYGPDSGEYLMMYDPESEWLYVYRYWDF